MYRVQPSLTHSLGASTFFSVGSQLMMLATTLLAIHCHFDLVWAESIQESPSSIIKSPKKIINAGPMVGFGGNKEVTLWLQTTRTAKVYFKYWPIAEPSNVMLSPSVKTNAESNHIAKITLSDLPSGQDFEYQVIINQTPQTFTYPLRFQTVVRWQRRQPPPDFKMAIGSCAYFNLDSEDHYGGGYEIFEQIRAQSPDLMLWLGDNLYLGPEDWSSAEGIYRRYAKQRSHPSIQALLASVHHYAIWDDHDYGPNDANRSYPLKGVSLDAFKQFWANPNYGLPDHPGIFGTFSWSDVDFFLLDDRTYRAPGNAPHSVDKPLLGQRQLQWLLDALAASRATFKIIAVGSQVLNPFDRFEGYAQHAQERDQLIKGLRSYGIEGVIFLSGDRHFSELNKLDDDPAFYPLYDFTSSPLTSGVASSVSDEVNNPLRVKGTLVSTQRSFGMISISGQGTERKLNLSALNAKGEELWNYVIRADELKVPTLP